ncbi:hypothetical protein HDU96_004248 [Phlyctochytrium bullatum]|nr:hypothetical protein HDU96_004248 [Phlyctochytrium bullatum]
MPLLRTLLTATALFIAFLTHSATAQLPMGNTYNGKATYYGDGGSDPPPIKSKGGIGACGYDAPPDERYFAALYQPLFNQHMPRWPSKVCGQCARVTCGAGNNLCQGRSVIVPIVDSCPGCEPISLDLSHHAFGELVGSWNKATEIGKIGCASCAGSETEHDDAEKEDDVEAVEADEDEAQGNADEGRGVVNSK